MDTDPIQQEHELYLSIKGKSTFCSCFPLCLSWHHFGLRFPKGSVSFLPFKAKRLARAYPSRPAGVNLNNETESRTQNHFVSPGSIPHQRVLAKAITASPEGIWKFLIVDKFLFHCSVYKFAKLYGQTCYLFKEFNLSCFKAL